MRIPKPVVELLLDLDAVVLGGALRRAVRNYGGTPPDRRAHGEMGLGELPQVARGVWRERTLRPGAYLRSWETPRFIGGATGRSGTTWLRNALDVGLGDTHTTIREVGLFDLAQFRGAPYEYLQYANLPQRDVYRNYFRDFILHRAYFIRRNLDGTLLGLCDLVPRRVVKAALDRLDGRLEEARKPKEIERSFGDFYLWLFNAHAELAAGGRPWISKEPPYGRNADQLFRMIPHGRLVVLVRDGRDVALSMHEHGWHPTVRDAMDRWRHFASRTARALSDCPDDRYLVVRYHDLVRDFRSRTGEIAEFLELPDLDMVSLEKRGLLPDESSLRRWETELPDDDRAYFETTCGPVMKRFNLPL